MTWSRRSCIGLTPHLEPGVRLILNCARRMPVTPVAGPAIVRGDDPDLFVRLQVIIGAEGLLGVALGERPEVDERGVRDLR
jgi:hypothetical protein